MKILTLSKTAVIDLIIEPEVSGKKYYTEKLQKPYWPGGISGVTIGLGFDLGHNSKESIHRNLTGILSPEQIFKLQRLAGVIGTACKTRLAEVSGVKISWEQAVIIFYAASLPIYAKAAARVYDELETLHPYEQTAIVGLVYNRGADMTGERRTEMKQLIQAIKDDNDTAMARLIRSMKRLWGSKQAGLLTRRELEAKYIEMPDVAIAESDKLPIPV